MARTPLSRVQIDEQLSRHRRWLASNGNESFHANFYRANLKSVDLAGADLHGQVLIPRHLQGKYREALRGSSMFSESNAEPAFLGRPEYLFQQSAERARTNRDWAVRVETLYTYGALFVLADCERANFAHAILRDANFIGANLSAADFSDADLQDVRFGASERSIWNLWRLPNRRTNLCGADLHTVKNLTQRQLDAALGDEHTKLPPGLKIRHV